MNYVLSVALLTLVTAVACALPGTFLVVRRQSMLAEAMSHTVLPGIVIAMLLVGSIDSPLLLIGAASAGMLVVVATEYLRSTGLLAGDSSLGAVYPALFAIGVILISTRFSGIAVSEGTVVTGDVNLAAIKHLFVLGHDVGPVYLWVMLGVLAANLAFITLCWKELDVASFDPQFAATCGMRPALVHYTLMLMVAITVTAAFTTAGSLLVIALIVVPAAAARLLCGHLGALMRTAVLFTVFFALAGFFMAYRLNVPTSAGLALTYGLGFVAVWAWSAYRSRRSRAGARAVRPETPTPAPGHALSTTPHTMEKTVTDNG